MNRVVAPRVATEALAELAYQTGFGNHFASEALPDALPPHN